MIARLRKLRDDAAEAFWLVPALLVLFAVALAVGLIRGEQLGLLPSWMVSAAYGGGDTGARTLLGAIASSSIGVAGTIFSVTIAALTLASSQMGPRLLRNFTRDIGNQATLGVLLGTFAFALMVLREVRGGEENVFVPHVALSVGIMLGLMCVGFVIYFVHHVASRINVETVIDLVHSDLTAAFSKLPVGGGDDLEPTAPLGDGDWLSIKGGGHLQQIDEDALIGWAADNGATIKLLVPLGAYVHPGAAVAYVAPWSDGAARKLAGAFVLGPRAGFGDIEFPARQLVEVAARALSPGVNDAFTAMRVLDRLGAGLCTLAERELPARSVRRDGATLLVRARRGYEDMVSTMFDLIRESAAGQSLVLMHMIGVLAAVVEREREPARLDVLQRQADLVLEDARRTIGNPHDLARLEAEHVRFVQTAAFGRPPREEGLEHPALARCFERGAGETPG